MFFVCFILLDRSTDLYWATAEFIHTLNSKLGSRTAISAFMPNIANIKNNQMKSLALKKLESCVIVPIKQFLNECTQ